jgi:hypothetical protein
MKYESYITCHSKDMANVEVFADRQTNRRTGQTLCAPDLLIRGHKNHSLLFIAYGQDQNIDVQ